MRAILTRERAPPAAVLTRKSSMVLGKRSSFLIKSIIGMYIVVYDARFWHYTHKNDTIIIIL